MHHFHSYEIINSIFFSYFIKNIVLTTRDRQYSNKNIKSRKYILINSCYKKIPKWNTKGLKIILLCKLSLPADKNIHV